MIKRFTTLFGRFHGEFQTVANLLLTDKILKTLRPETIIENRVALVERVAGTFIFHEMLF